MTPLYGNYPYRVQLGYNTIGDGQQTMYPGGYSLAEAGISVAGRGVVLSTNHRITREIASTAVEGDEFVDLEGGPGRADAALDVPRTGPLPVFASFESVAAHDSALVSRVSTLVASGTDPRDIGVLTATNRAALAKLAELGAAWFEVIELESFASPLAITLRRQGGPSSLAPLPHFPGESDLSWSATTIHACPKPPSLTSMQCRSLTGR